jgi:3-oxoacyl-(acyl-carrier-protein) synthase
MSSEIWITGIGIVSPLGIGREAVADSLSQGLSAIRPIEQFEVGDFEVQEAAEVRDFNPRELVKNRKALKISRRNTHLALAAGTLAWRDAQLEGRVEPERAGIVMSAGRITPDLKEVSPLFLSALDDGGRLNLQLYAQNCPSFFPPYWFLRHIPNMVPAHIAIELNLKAPSDTTCMTVVGGLLAMDTAASILRRGDADVMLAGASETLVEPYHLVTHLQEGRLDTRVSASPRPFSPDARGTVLGEGSTILVLERAEFAERTGAKPLAILEDFTSGGYLDTQDRENPTLLRNNPYSAPPDLTLLGGTGWPSFDRAEIELAQPSSSFACYRPWAGWQGSVNGPHDLACFLLSGYRSPQEIFPRQEPIQGLECDSRFQPGLLKSGQRVAVQSVSWAGQFAALTARVP